MNKMRKMKDSGIAWIGEIPEGWSVLKLKNKYAYKKEIVGEKANDFERLALTLRGVIKRDKYDSEGLQPKEFNNYQIIRENDLIFKMIDLQNVSTSRVGLSKYSGIVSPAYIRFTQKSNDIYGEFIYYFLMSLYYNFVFNSMGDNGVRSALNSYDMGNLDIPYPSNIEQQKIADFLDKKCAEIDKLIELQESMIEKLKEYKQSVITQAVTKGLDPDVPMKDSGIEWIGKIPEGWEVVRIKDIGSFRNGVIYSPEDLVDEGNGTLVLRSSNIKDGKLVLEDNVYISATIKDNLMVKKGDILICSRNGSKALIGKNAIIDRDINAAFGAFMMIFRCKNPKYTYYILNSEVFAYYLGSYLTSTINQLTGKNFGNMQIIYAKDIQTQHQIADYLDKKCAEIDDLIKLKEQKIEKLKEYKKSLIYEYVTGKKEVV